MERRRRVGAYGIARDAQGRTLLVRSSAKSNHQGMWYPPGGGLDHGEDPNDGVVREFLEETGLRVQRLGIREVSSDVVEFPWRGVMLHHDRIIFDVKVVGGSLTVESDGTTDLPIWVTAEELPTLPIAPFAARALGLSIVDAGTELRPSTPDDAGEFLATGYALSGARQVTRFGAYGIVTDPAGRVLLSLISQGYPGGGNWHLPGGGTDFGEQPAQGLLREIFEESGQVGRVVEAVSAGARHHPVAMGPEGEPLDWYTVRTVFRVTVAEPREPQVTEAAGGSTAMAKWFSSNELPELMLSDLARGELLHIEQDAVSGRIDD